MKVGLVLEGGGMRGMYTAGVIDMFLEKSIKVDCIIGVSAGALFGVNYCSNQKGRVLRYQKNYIKTKNYMGLTTLIKTGNIINKEFAYYDIPFKLDIFDEETFSKSKTKFYLTVTDVETGKAEYINIKDTKKEMEYFRATSAMPFVSKIVEIKDKKYLDGALADSIPIKEMQKMGYDKIIVVLTKPYGYKKRKPLEFLAKQKYKNYPNLIKAINTRYEHYNQTIDEINKLEKEKQIIVIRPSKKIKMNRVEKNIKKIQKMYNLGIEDSKRILKDLKKYLSN